MWFFPALGFALEEKLRGAKAVSSRVFYSAFFSILNSISTPAGFFSLIISL